VALAGCVWVAWGGFGPALQTTGDDSLTFAPAFHALLGGHVAAFFDHLPNDGAGGSVLLRLPFAALGDLMSPSQLTNFRFGALECELALAALGLVLVVGYERAGVRASWRFGVLALLVLAPALLGVVHLGHPEEALGAALCIGAVLLAGAGRSHLAGLLLGTALINKPWGLLALAPVLLALDARRDRLVCALIAGAIASSWVLAVAIGAPSFGNALAGLSAPPWPGDVWWPFTAMHPARAGAPYRALPPLLSIYGRDVAGAVGLAVGAFAALRSWVPAPTGARRGGGFNIERCLALLALTFLLRCALDPSNLLYYELPFVVATAAWEARRARPPLLALLACAWLWLVYHPLAAAGSGIECAGYLLGALPFGWALAHEAFGGRSRVWSGAECSPAVQPSQTRIAARAARAVGQAP
jgi:hypothetical protein